jgi:hypothetical protein
MFLDPLKQKKSRSHVGSLADHMRIRSQDFFSTTSTEIDYSSFAFDVLLNEKLNYNNAKLTLKKGPEFLSKRKGDGLDFGSRDMGMLFDRVEAHGPVNELAAFIKTMGKSDFFLTVTANQQRTPGLAALTKHMKHFCQVYDFSDWNRNAVATGFMPMMVQTFYRTIRYMFHWIAHGGDKPFGPVKSYWYRYVKHPY